jgi:hypothetical protein
LAKKEKSASRSHSSGQKHISNHGNFTARNIFKALHYEKPFESIHNQPVSHGYQETFPALEIKKT